MSMCEGNDFSDLYAQLERTFAAAPQDTQAANQLVAEAPFQFDKEMALLFLGFITISIVDEDAQMLQAVAATDNERYQQSIAGYNFVLEDYRVPLSATENSAAQAVQSGKQVISTNWDTFRRPDVAEGVARLNQASSGIGISVAVPLPGRIRGVLMYNFFQFEETVGEQQQHFMDTYARLVSGLLDGLPAATESAVRV